MSRGILVGVIVCLLASVAWGQDGVQRKYDEFKDVTTFTIGPFPLGAPTYGEGEDARLLVGPTKLYAIVSCVGKMERCQEKQVSILVIADTRSWSFGRLREAVFLADDKPVGPVKYDWDGQVHGARALAEYVSFYLRAEEFRKISSAKKCKVRLSIFSMALPEETLAGLRGMDAHLELPVSKEKK
jgi:hypothetical protein